MNINRALNLKLKDDFYKIKKWCYVSNSVFLQFTNKQDLNSIKEKLDLSSLQINTQKCAFNYLWLCVKNKEKTNEEIRTH